MPPEKELTEAQLLKQLEGGAQLLRHPWARMAWAKVKGGAKLFVNGHAYPASAELAEYLCREREWQPEGKLPAAVATLLLALVNDGHLVVRKSRRR